MMKISKIISIATALAMLFVSSSGSLKTITDEIEIKAAEATLTGDVSGNNRVDILDLIMTKSEVLDSNSVTNKKVMDVTGDGIVDFRDAREIQQYLLNQSDDFTKNLRDRISNVNTEIVSSNQPIETSVTAEMAAKANELGDAVSVYNYLYNNMRSEFYFGSRKGAIGTYEQGGGNDIDLSSLLIAMLRYLGYEADYVTSKAGFTEDQIKKWTNADSAEVAHSILSSQKRNNQIVDIEGSTFYFYDYKYVQVKDKGKTYYLDVCFKEYVNQKTIYDDIYCTSNSKKILENADIKLFNEEMSKSEVLASNMDGQAYLYSSKIVTKKIDKLDSENPHIYDLDIETSNVLSDDCSDLVYIGFDGKDPVKFRSAELYNKNITVNYKVSSDSYEIASILGVNADSIFNLSPDVYGEKMSVDPVVKINNEEILTGSSLNIGDEQTFYISTRTGGVVQHYKEVLSAGEICCVVFDTGHVSANELSSSYSAVLNNTERINQKNNLGYDMKSTGLNETNVFSSEYIGSMLRFTGTMYFSQVDITTQALAEKTNVHCESALRFGVIGYKPSVYVGLTGFQIQGQKYGIQKEGQYFLDILGNQTYNISRTGNLAQMLSFSTERGLISSELESTVIEEVLNVQSLSTTEIFRHAQENSIPIISLSKNSEIKLSDLNYDKDDAERIQSEIDNGCTVLSTQTKVSIGKWSGIGYIVIAPDGFSQKYMISGGYNGGVSVDPVPLYYCINTALDIAMIAESVIALTGILAVMSSLALGPVAAVLLSVVSITFLVIDIMEQSFLLYDYEINDNMEAGLQIWANTAVNSVVTIATMGVGKGISKIGSAVTDSRLSRTYGKTVVNNIKDYGFTANEINLRVKKFKSLGFSQSTIDTLLKDSKCMYLEDSVLYSISKTGSNQEMISNLIIKTDPSFYESIFKNGLSEHFIDILSKYESGTVLAINNGIEKEAIERLDDICGITPDIYIGNSKGNSYAYGGKRIASQEQAVNVINIRENLSEKFGEDALNDLRAAAIKFETILKTNKGAVTNTNMGPAVAVVYAPKSGKFYFAVNNISDGVGENLTKVLGDRVILAKTVEESYNKFTKGAGSHAEVKAFNAAILDGNAADDLIGYVNYTKKAVNSEVKACSFVTCPHCNMILEGFNVLSDVDVVKMSGNELLSNESKIVKNIDDTLKSEVENYFSIGDDNPLLHNNKKVDEVVNVIIISTK